MNKRMRKRQAARDLRAAASIVEAKGWDRYAFHRHRGRLPEATDRVCIVRAVCEATTGMLLSPENRASRNAQPRYRAAIQLINEWCIARGLGACVCEFNEHAPGVEFVTAQIRACADFHDPAPQPSPGPLVPVYADATERRRAYRAELLRRGVDTSDLEPLNDPVTVPDHIPAEWEVVR